MHYGVATPSHIYHFSVHTNNTAYPGRRQMKYRRMDISALILMAATGGSHEESTHVRRIPLLLASAGVRYVLAREGVDLLRTRHAEVQADGERASLPACL